MVREITSTIESKGQERQDVWVRGQSLNVCAGLKA